MENKFKFLIIIIAASYSLFFNIASASETNGAIVSGGNNGYAWSNQAGWVNFGCSNCGISITDSGIMGYAWNNNYGWINMAPTNGGVMVAADGALSGYAWSTNAGWVNFSGASINSSGKFTGVASSTTIGALSFDCANCSVTTDFRAQNFRTAAPTQTIVVSGGGGGGGGGITSVAGPEGQSVPAHLNAFNVPLRIFNTQSGILVQNFTDGIRAVVNIPRDASPARELVINVAAESVDPALSTVEQRVVGGVLFSVVARDGEGNVIKTFSRLIQITLEVPEELQGRDDLGVYFFNEGLGAWEKVSNATFTGKTANFFVDHLTLFGIFSAADLPAFLHPFFPIMETASIRPQAPIGTFAPGEAPLEAREESLPAQLFDINLEIENTKITDIKNLIARMIFTSFGRVPTPVDLTFDILNEKGEKIYSKKDEITVRTQEVLTERFTNIDKILEHGKYTLLVTTLYNVSVVDEFKQNFEIVAPEEIKTPFWKWVWFWIISTVAFISIFIFVFKKLNEEENYKRF